MTYLPFGLSFWILCLVAGLIRYRSRYGRPMVAAGTVGLFLWAWPPFAALFSATLEPRPVADRAKIAAGDAIVVLGGGAYHADASEPETLPAFNTYLRCHYAAWLYHHATPVPVLVTGGAVSGNRDVILAETMKQALLEDGVPSDRIWVEDQSRSTYENAVYSARLLRAKGVRRAVVVTEGYHIRRSAACFRKQGLEVLPAPVANVSSHWNSGLRNWWPSTVAITEDEDILHEWGGLVWYRLTGRS